MKQILRCYFGSRLNVLQYASPAAFGAASQLNLLIALAGFLDRFLARSWEERHWRR